MPNKPLIAGVAGVAAMAAVLWSMPAAADSAAGSSIRRVAHDRWPARMDMHPGAQAHAAPALTSQANTADPPSNFSITFGDAGQQTPSSTIRDNAEVFGIETFNTRSTGSVSTSGFTTFFPVLCKPAPCGGSANSQIMGTYRPGGSNQTTIRAADVFGGSTLMDNGSNGNGATASGVTRYIDTNNGTSYTLTFTTRPITGRPPIAGENYFGLWISALDPFNELIFKENGTTVGTFVPEDLIRALGACSSSGPITNPFCGNPNSRFNENGQRGNRGELYAYVNFVDKTGFFNEVVFDQIRQPGSGTSTSPRYESDNQAVAFCLNPTACISGTPVPPPVVPTPEPGTGPLLLIGLAAMAGLAYRRRRRRDPA